MELMLISLKYYIANTPPPANKNNNNQGSSKSKVISLSVSSSTEIKPEKNDSKESLNSQPKSSGETTKKQNVPKSGKLQDIETLMKNDNNQSGKDRLNLIVVGKIFNALLFINEYFSL